MLDEVKRVSYSLSYGVTFTHTPVTAPPPARPRTRRRLKATVWDGDCVLSNDLSTDNTAYYYKIL